jgi:hypothetical protein
MFKLLLRRQLPLILGFAAAALFIAIGIGALLDGARDSATRPLGDPNAPRPTTDAPTPITLPPVTRPLGDPNAPRPTTDAPTPITLPPVTRPAAVPPEAVIPQSGSDMTDNLIDVRTPDEQFLPAAVVALRCAFGADAAHDPALDEVALEYWRSTVRGEPTVIDHPYNDPMRASSTIALVMGFDPTRLAADPCAYGKNDLAANFPLSAGDATRIIAFGVAQFVDPKPAPGMPPGALAVFIVLR